MDVYIAVIGELIIIATFVFYLWLQVLIKSVGVRSIEPDLAALKVLLTSIGLVFTAFAILGIMIYRVYELATGNWPFVNGIVIFYVVLAVGKVMFIVSASLGTNWRLFKVFVSMSALWTGFCVYMAFV